MNGKLINKNLSNNKIFIKKKETRNSAWDGKSFNSTWGINSKNSNTTNKNLTQNELNELKNLLPILMPNPKLYDTIKIKILQDLNKEDITIGICFIATINDKNEVFLEQINNDYWLKKKEDFGLIPPALWEGTDTFIKSHLNFISKKINENFIESYLIQILENTPFLELFNEEDVFSFLNIYLIENKKLNFEDNFISYETRKIAYDKISKILF